MKNIPHSNYSERSSTYDDDESNNSYEQLKKVEKNFEFLRIRGRAFRQAPFLKKTSGAPP